jgi:menaquinone-9 beta-reductase
MAAEKPHYDVAVVGASIAGGTAALLFAQAGLRVALVERSPDPNAYKKVCTHYIQASATPTLRRLGLVERMEAAGAVRNGVDLWTRWGWIRWRDPDRPHGYNIRRQVLDPMVRALAAETPGVDFFPGEAVESLVERGGRVAGIRTRNGSRRHAIEARLTVGADGRSSSVARLAGLQTKVRANARFAYFAYYQDLPLPSGTHSMMWFLEPDIAYAFPNDDGQTILACMPVKSRLPEFRRDLEGSYRRFLEALPDAPPANGARRVSGILGMLDMPNLSRPAARPGLALVGDAAMASDPLWGVGCGWAFQSAEWLADATVGALGAGTDQELDRALRRYAKKHRSDLAGHHFLISDFASGRPYNLLERLLFSAAVHDFPTARHVDAFANRWFGVGRFLSPAALARAAWRNLMYGRGRHDGAGNGRAPGSRAA